MDVNKPESVRPVGDQPHRQQQSRQQDTTNDNPDPDDDRQDRHPWSADAAVDVDVDLAGALTPEVQKILDAVGGQIEPLRAELELAKKREAHYREIAEGHPFLPVPNRREFLRELKHVIDHIESLQPAAALVIVHVASLGDIRRRLGRRAADEALKHVADSFDVSIHPTDAVGSLCGDDFGVILLNGGAEEVRRRISEIHTHLRVVPFSWMDQAVPIEIATGWTELKPGWSAEQAVAAADRELMGSLSGG